jgi:hypothetical protein
MSVREFQDALLARNLVARIANLDPADLEPEGLEKGPTSLSTPSEAGVKQACGGACNPPLDPTVQEFSDAVMAERVAGTIKSG